MARIVDVIEGLSLLSHYLPQDEHLGGAEHGIIYAGDCDEKMRPAENSADGKRLKGVGWHGDSETGGGARFC